MPPPGPLPVFPVQVSATSHWPAEARHVWLAAWKTSTHELSVPVQWSAASLSHRPPCEAPVQLVDAEAKPSAGHTAVVPVHGAATSHWPAAARHGVDRARVAYAHAVQVPEQWPAASMS